MSQDNLERKFWNVELNDEREEHFDILAKKLGIKTKSKIFDILLREAVKNPEKLQSDFLSESRSAIETIQDYIKEQREEMRLFRKVLFDIDEEIQSLHRKFERGTRSQIFGKENDRWNK